MHEHTKANIFPKIAIATANVSIVWHYDSQSAHLVGMHADKIKQTVIEYKQVESQTCLLTNL